MKFRSVLPLLMALLLLGACSESNDPGPVVPAVSLGKAHLTSPLVGAKVEVQDASGRSVMTLNRLTGPTGQFMFVLPPAQAARFRLVVSGGTHEGKPFDDVLLLDVERFDPKRDLLYVNAATSLISRYLDAHPGMGVAAASAKVKSFLGIPATSDPGFSVDNPRQRYFRHEVLLAAAQQAGATKLSDYFTRMVGEIDSGVTSRTYAAAALTGVADVAEKLAEWLGESLGDELFSWGFEAILTALGTGGNAEILNQLHEINAKLDELKIQVSKLDSDVLKVGSAVVSNSLVTAITNIEGHNKVLTWAAQGPFMTCLKDASGKILDTKECPADDLLSVQNAVRTARSEILNGNDGVVQHFETIRVTLVGSPGTGPGLFSMLRDYYKSSAMFDAPVVDARLLYLNEYYKIVLAMASQLIVEARMAEQNAGGQSVPNRPMAQQQTTQLKDAIKAQDEVVAKLRRENESTVEDLRTKLIWLRAPVSNIPESDYHTWWDENRHWTFREGALQQCDNLANKSYAGYTGWRLPTDPELHEVVKGGSSNGGNAGGKPGIFAWLIQQGFQGAPGNGQPYQRGFLTSAGAAYFSKTVSGDGGFFTGRYSEALWDTGVNFACDVSRECSYPDNLSSAVGAWCVTEGKSE